MARKRLITPKHGIETLKAPGYNRAEQLKKRADKLARTAEILTKDSEIYSIDRSKLKEEPEILKHFNFLANAFDVSNKKPGYVYYWERDDTRMISWRRAQARHLLGPNHEGWHVVSGHDGQCMGGSKCKCEANDLIQADGSRTIGDVKLMAIPLDSYIAIQKRQLMMQKFLEASIPQKLEDFMRENEGLIQVHNIVGETVEQHFAKQGAPIQRSVQSEPLVMHSAVAKAGQIIDSEETE